jgi:hypothetical protein
VSSQMLLLLRGKGGEQTRCKDSGDRQVSGRKKRRTEFMAEQKVLRVAGEGSSLVLSIKMTKR